MPIYTLGTDVSRYNDNGLPPFIDFKKMAAKGVIYTVIRLTSGVNEDRDAERNVKAAQDAGMIVAGYTWWDYTKDRQTQTAKFLNSYDKLKVSYPAIDIENFGTQPMPQGSISINTVNAMMKEILAATEKKCMFYSNGDILKNYLTPHPADWYTYPLWLASPGLYPPSGKQLYGWSNWSFWQFTWKLYGPDYGVGPEAKDLDGDYYNGTESELRKLFGLQIIDPPLPPTLTLEDRVDKLEEQARLHGWTI